MLDIDLLYTHVWDYGTPLEETLETLHWLVQQGKVENQYFLVKSVDSLVPPWLLMF